MSKQVVKLAVAWWVNHRPANFTEGRHLLNPMVNTKTSVEAALAIAVANYVRSKRKAIKR
jgi:hypothetical protein